MVAMLVSLLTGSALADEAVDITPALAAAKKPKWDPKGKTIDAYGRGEAKNRQRSKAGGLAASVFLVQAVDTQPGCGKCLNQLASALTYGERYGDAVKVAEHLRDLYPERKEGNRRLATAHFQAKNWTEAAAAYSAAIEQDPKNIILWQNRTDSLRLAGKLDEARSVISGATEQGLDQAAVDCLRIQLAASEGDAAEARKLWASCEEAKNLDVKRFSEGWLAMAEGNTELATTRLAMSGGDEELTRIALAFLRLDQGKPKAALNLADKAIEEGDDHWDTQVAKARALLSLGRAEEALAVLDAGPMAAGWEEAHKNITVTKVMLTPRGPDWPVEVVRMASAAKIAALVAQGKADEAQAAYDATVAVHGAHESFDEALKSTDEGEE